MADEAALGAPPADWSPPAASYFICTTPRSGSTYLCRLLRATGRAGRPDEHAAEGRAGAPADADAATWLRRLVARGSTANGVFGCKLFPPHHVALLRSAGPRLADWLPGLRHVLLTRRDLLGQAISFAIAAQTDEWLSLRRPEQPREPRYDAALIARLLDRLVEWEGYWRRYLALAGATPLELAYEAVEADPRAALDRLLPWLGLPPLPPDATPEQERPIAVQRTQRNAEWRARFLEDMARAGHRLEDRPHRARPGARALVELLRGQLVRPAFQAPRRRRD